MLAFEAAVSHNDSNFSCVIDVHPHWKMTRTLTLAAASKSICISSSGSLITMLPNPIKTIGRADVDGGVMRVSAVKVRTAAIHCAATEEDPVGNEGGRAI